MYSRSMWNVPFVAEVGRRGDGREITSDRGKRRRRMG
jgi:hypothetical protein